MDKRWQRNKFYKTRLCPYHFKKGSTCKEGAYCSYAHSFHELRPSVDLTKTKLCNDYLSGNCPRKIEYCPFAHGPKDLRHPIVPSAMVYGAGEADDFCEEELSQFIEQQLLAGTAGECVRGGELGMYNKQRNELDTRELGGRELGSRELGGRELGSRDLRSRELGGRELGTREPDSRELGARELGSRELSTRELAAREPARSREFIAPRKEYINHRDISRQGSAHTRLGEGNGRNLTPPCDLRRSHELHQAPKPGIGGGAARVATPAPAAELKEAVDEALELLRLMALNDQSPKSAESTADTTEYVPASDYVPTPF